MTAHGVYSNNFAEAFSQVLEKANVSCYKISQYSHLDEAYLSRLKNGEKHNPSPETIVRISMALAHLSAEVKLYDLEKLFNATGRSLFPTKKIPDFHD